MAQPADKSPEIRKFQSELMGNDVEGAITQDICVSCRLPVNGFRNAISEREFTISGFCQSCQDRVFESCSDDD